MAIPESDDILIAACMAGDESSFARLVERYEAAVAGILWRFTRDRLRLEELVQDTFVEAYFSLKRFHRSAPFYPWLRTIATRVGYRSWRSTRRDQGRAARLHDIGTEFTSPPPTASLAESSDYVYRMLDKLRPKDRLVLMLQYVEGCSTNEISERMGWNVSLVKVRAFRARRKLKTLLERERKYRGNQ